MKDALHGEPQVLVVAIDGAWFLASVGWGDFLSGGGIAGFAQGGGIDHVYVPRHQRGEGFVRLFAGVSPQQFAVPRFLHLLKNVRCAKKRPSYFRLCSTMIRREMKTRYLAPLLFSWKTLPLDVILPELMMTGDK